MFSSCRFSTPAKNAEWLSLHDSVHYVGMQTCRGCHAEIYNTYIETGMGRSFALATGRNSRAVFDNHTRVYDSLHNLYYFPFLKNDSLFIKEYRLQHNDTIYQRTEHVAYIIGSGNHTNSHLVSFNGFLYQAPITFYTQKKKWDWAPGFEGGFNARFNRIITIECMTCHNGLPELVAGSENLYRHLPQGIDCERCHGPGELHVKEKQAGIWIDTSIQPDYTIVNPRRLSKKLQMSLCQRCHLQGISVLNEGKQFDHFKPGMNLGDVFHVFLPEFESKQHNFLMASHAERLSLSKCYLNSQMTCITCHNPHISVKQTPLQYFNAKCFNCHSEHPDVNTQKKAILSFKSRKANVKCSLPVKERMENNCAGCHMPKSASIDIPHVSITDHYIRKKNLLTGTQLSLEEVEKIQKFVQLKCYTSENPDALLKARAFLAFYEKFSSKPVYLDSAAFYLKQVKNAQQSFGSWVHYYYLKNDFNAIISFKKNAPHTINDAWTCYRIGEAHYQMQLYAEAIEWYEKAVTLSPYHPDFMNKLASAYFQTGNKTKSKKIYEHIISLQPKYKEALGNLGYIYLTENNFVQAKQYLEQALMLDPDYERALLNKAILHYRLKEKSEALKILKHITARNPQHQEAKQLLQMLH
jgi:cytochrome c-type biogenesis protein CcmH/NrfG